MYTIKKTLWAFTFLFSLSVLACVTINIYFPAEKVESVPGEIVKDVRGHDNPSEDDSSLLRGRTILAFFCGAAWAQEEAVSVSNPVIRGLKEKMKERFPLLKPYFKKGVIAEGDDGYVTIVSTEGLGVKKKRDIKNLVEAENKNRKTLYVEVAKALNIKLDQVERIEAIFAEEWKASLEE